MSALCSFFLLALPTWAQEPVVITGAREPIAAARVVGDVIVIDAERIAASGADSVEDLLRRQAGVQLSRSGVPGANAGIFIRGANSGHTLVLIDGVRIGSATAGLAEFEGLSLASIERIEVLRGPGSSLYGADAVGGVVQLITRRAGAAPVATASLALGGLGSREAAVSGSTRSGAFDLAASLGHESSRGVSALRPGDRFGNYNPDRDGFTRRSAQGQVGFTPSVGQRVALTMWASRLDAQHDASEFAPPSFAQDATPDFRNRLELRSAALEHRASWSPQWSSVLRLTDQSSDLRSGATMPDHYRTARQQFEGQLSWRTAASQQLTLALDSLEESAQASSYARRVARRNHGAVLAWTGGFGALDTQAEMRRDDNSAYGSATTARLGGSYRLSPSWRARALVGTTFQAPSFNDLFYPGYGVATLQPARGRSVEAGVEYRQGPSRLAFTAYRNQVRELIAYESDRRFCPAGNEFDYGCARNIGRAQLQGATIEGATTLGAWQLRGHLEFLDAVDQRTGARLTRRATNQQSLAADWRSGSLTLGAELLAVGARPEGGKMLAAYRTLDLKARWRVAPGWQLTAQLRNATDSDYQPALDYRALPRQAWLGLSWQGP